MIYHGPATLNDAYRLYDGKSVYIAGGTDLGVLLADLVIEPEQIIDLCGIPELCGISETADGFRIGACTGIYEIAAAKKLPRCLTAGASAIGSPQIRNMATIGGNICNASPCGDTLTPLLVLGAVFELYSSSGVRTVPAGDFFTGPKKTVLNKGEILTAILIPGDSVSGTVSGFRMTGKRNGQVISQVNMAVCAKVDSGKIKSIKIAAGSVAPVPLRLLKCEMMLAGKSPAEAADAGFLAGLKAAAELETSPISDVRAGEDYRRIVSGSLLESVILELFSGDC